MASQPLPVAQQGAQRWLRKDGLKKRLRQLSAEAPAGGAASGGQRRGRVIEPVRERLDQKGQEKMGQNPWLC